MADWECHPALPRLLLYLTADGDCDDHARFVLSDAAHSGHEGLAGQAGQGARAHVDVGARAGAAEGRVALGI